MGKLIKNYFFWSLVNERKINRSYKTSAENYIDIFLKEIEENKNISKNSVYTGTNKVTCLGWKIKFPKLF